MNIELALWKVVINLPESLKTELLNYAEYLQEKYPHNKQSQEKIETVGRYGSWACLLYTSDAADD